MIGNSQVSLFATSSLAVLVLCAAGCAEKALPEAKTPARVTAEVTIARPPPAPTVPVTSSLSVSEELLTTCKLNFNDIRSAPKFDFDRSALAADDDAILSQIAACVTTGPLAGRALQLIGRADPRGESEYNMALGTRRASSVGDFLAGRGVNSSNLEMSSRGKLDATGADEAGWQRDRRVDIVLN